MGEGRKTVALHSTLSRMAPLSHAEQTICSALKPKVEYLWTPFNESKCRRKNDCPEAVISGPVLGSAALELGYYMKFTLHRVENMQYLASIALLYLRSHLLSV